MLDQRHVEVDEKAEPLGSEYRMHHLDRFQFTNDLLFHQHVQAQPLIEGDPVIDDGHDYLTAVSEAAFAQLVAKADLVDAFQ